MKTYVKVISSVILFILSVTDLAGIIFYGKAFRLAVEQIKGLTPLSEAGEYRFFDSLFGYPLGVFFLIIFSVMILVFAAELLLKLLFYRGARRDGSFDMYLVLAVTALIEEIVNVLLSLVALNEVINLDAVHTQAEAAIEKGVMIWLGIYLFTGIWILSDIISANKCIKAEKEADKR